jgi:hypothetical protein
MLGSFTTVISALRLKEEDLGRLIEVEADRLKVWFEDTNSLNRAVGDVTFESVYAVGKPFLLQPPFGILYSPRKNKCWVRCQPEVATLASENNYQGDEDAQHEGFVQL